MTFIRWVLAAANATVALLNARAYIFSRDERDLWAFVAWTGSTAVWMLQAMVL